MHFLWIFYANYGIYIHTMINNPVCINTRDLLPQITSSLTPQSMITFIKALSCKYPQHLVSNLLSHWVFPFCCCLCTIQELALSKLKLHWNNSQGFKCTNPTCPSLPHAGNHNLDHCYWSSGGMEDKAPAWIHNCSKLKTEMAAVSTTPLTPTDISSPTIMHHCELFCMLMCHIHRFY